jgi:hypothetical protein
MDCGQNKHRIVSSADISVSRAGSLDSAISELDNYNTLNTGSLNALFCYKGNSYSHAQGQAVFLEPMVNQN